ncbi:ubiquitin-associated protein 1-like isoform X3 [Grus americana]|uniref:ubiquitin-associated protein 1-like isoform X3 n=1 Tax=Grus americana TaxID=9117 RepID=UPI0024085429|nr:ubiquitin-associated protein 1-like isoform X3 [Grus americana]
MISSDAVRNQVAAMSYLDEVPFRTARSLDGDSGGENTLITAPAIDLPDCTDILMSTMHDFSLERKVLYWVEVASQQQTSWHRVTSEVVPTAPPCWLLLVDPADSYGGRARDGAVRRCVSLSAADGRGALSDTESETWHSEEDEYSEDDEYSSTSWEENDKDEKVSRRRNAGRSAAPRADFYQIRPKTSPGLLEPSPENGDNPASPDPSKQRRSMVIFNNMKNELEAARRKLAALVHPLNRATTESRGVPVPRPLPQHPRTSRSVKYGPAPDVSQLGTLVPAPPAVAAPIPPIKRHKPTVPIQTGFMGKCPLQPSQLLLLAAPEEKNGDKTGLYLHSLCPGSPPLPVPMLTALLHPVLSLEKATSPGSPCNIAVPSCGAGWLFLKVGNFTFRSPTRKTNRLMIETGVV